MWSLWCLVALAAPERVSAERAWLLVEAGQQREAREMLAEALEESQSPELVAAYVDASTEMGLGPRALAEVRGMDGTLPWEVQAEPLAERVAAGDVTGTLALVGRIQEAHPGHVEVFGPLWREPAERKVVKLRQQILRTTPDAPEGQVRLLQLRQQIGVTDEALRVSVEQAFEIDAYGVPATDVQLHDLARGLVEKGLSVADLDRTPGEKRIAVQRAQPLFLLEGRPADAEAAWVALGDDDAGAWGQRSSAALAAGDTSGAVEAAEAGFLALGRPTPDDAAVSDRSRRATWAEQLLASASEAHLKVDRGGLSWAEAVAATALAGEVRGPETGPLAATSLAATFPGPDKVAGALRVAREAVDADAERRAVEGAWVAVAALAPRLEAVARDPDLYLAALGDAWAAIARTLADNDNDSDAERALAYGTLALVTGVHDAELEAALARLHARLDGEPERSDAVFHHAAIARGLGADAGEMEALIQEHHEGLGDALAVATALGGEPPPPDVEPAPPPERVATRSSRRRSQPPKRGAVLGEPAPAFSAESAYGTLSSQRLKGRVVILTFFASDHAPSVEQLKVSGALARRLRASGRDVVHVGISRDANRGLFDDLHRIGQRWGNLAWAPEVATAFGVQRQPTTWVVDANGIARYFVDHRIESPELEAAVTSVLLP